VSGASVFEAFLLVFVSALNPAALVACAVYLDRERGIRLGNGLLIGGLLISLLVGVVVLLLVRSTGLELPKNRTPRFGVRLGLGILGLALAAFLPWVKVHLRRGTKAPHKPGLVTRLMDTPRVGGAVLVGVLIFVPSVQYLSGVQTIATAERGITAAVLLIVVAAIINVTLVWVLLAAYLRSPDWTQVHLNKANAKIAWVKNHGEIIVRIILTIVGVYLVISGATGLATR
jgi:Sap, sulfolipid-1-addressing protein